MLIVDSNVVISCLLRKGIPYKVFLLNFLFEKFKLIAPEFLWVEVEKHKEELLKETKLPAEEFEEILEFLREEIDIIPAVQFLELLPKAKEILPTHTKDALYLALALKFNSPIFSGDKRLKKQSSVKILSPREILDRLLERTEP